ncbi:DUF2637 domain-containing protein [Streptomyces sp. NBC_00040]|uniref:DUF2637 domain-containing protein n=1 Tax=Streptomyces sp. NBC_00040 TaxID=2903616 RepID=UPI002F918D19
MVDCPAAPPPFTKAQKWAISLAGVFFAGLAGLGGYGSFAAVEQEARKYGFTEHSWIVPIGVDLGILALLVVDLILEQLDMSLPPLRWLAWVFTAATIWFNIATVSTSLPWHEQITGKGMHAAMPLLFIAFMEGVRHAVRRRTGMLSNRRMDGIRLSRWLTDPFGTAGIWRRMVLWEVRSYRTGLVLERHRRERVGALRTQYGWLWRFKAPAEAKWPLRGGMLDLALELTGTTWGTSPATTGDHPALPAPATSPAVPTLGTVAPELPPAPTGMAPFPNGVVPASGTVAPELAPAPVQPVPTPEGTAVLPNPATSEETGPRRTGTAAAHSHTPGTITVTVPADHTADGDHGTQTGTTDGDHGTEPGTTDGDHEHTEGTATASSSTLAPATGPGPQRTGAFSPDSEGRYPEMDLAQGTSPRARQFTAAPTRPDIDDIKLAEARDLARGIIRAGSGKVSRRSLKAAGLTGKTETLQEIADLLNDEITNGELVLDETA